jgi:dephospho-CoA kinase
VGGEERAAPRLGDVLKVGLTGGIGSGKSEAARLLAHRGAVVVDADALARDVVAPGTAGFAAVVAEFGAGILAGDGSIDRPALGRLVFGDPAALRRLEAIVHPQVARRSAELMAAAPADAVVVYDVPLLVEKDLAGDYDVVVVVDVPEQVQLRRLVEARGMSEGDALARIRAQATRAQRRAVADVVIDNSGSREELDRRVDAVWRLLEERRDAPAPRPAGSPP